MAGLEDFAQVLTQRGAPSLTITAGQTVVLGWEHGDERLGAAPNQDDVTQMLLSSAPRDALDKLHAGMAPHPYALDAVGKSFFVRVALRGDAWRVTLTATAGGDDDVLEGELLDAEVLEALEPLEEIGRAHV